MIKEKKGKDGESKRDEKHLVNRKMSKTKRSVRLMHRCYEEISGTDCNSPLCLCPQ